MDNVIREEFAELVEMKYHKGEKGALMRGQGVKETSPGGK